MLPVRDRGHDDSRPRPRSVAQPRGLRGLQPSPLAKPLRNFTQKIQALKRVLDFTYKLGGLNQRWKPVWSTGRSDRDSLTGRSS